MRVGSVDSSTTEMCITEMLNAWILATLVTLIYALLKLAEMHFLEKKMKPLKLLVRDIAFVFGASLAASYGYLYLKSPIDDFFTVLIADKGAPVNLEDATIFTDDPGF